MNSSTPQPNNPIAPGSTLAAKYRVERILGQGGMGVVVEARHMALDERVALKFLLPDYAQHPEASARFLREARAAVRIKSEHVARVSDVGTLETGAPYMVMEFLEGNDLSKVLEKSGVLQIEDAVDYVIQACEAIAEAHSYGIVHRDIKPANLFLGRRPNGSPIVKVLDFGISKVMDNAVDNLTKTTAAMGSALYMSPEQMQQTRGVDSRTDIYALGISLYELLAGRQPFYADTLPQLCAEIFAGTPTPIRNIRQDVPESLAVVLEKAYARDRVHRFQSVAEFVLALAPYAPPRSRPMVESIAQLVGLQGPVPTVVAPLMPVAGAGPRAGSSPQFDTNSRPSHAGMEVGRQTGQPVVAQAQDSSINIPVRRGGGVAVGITLGVLGMAIVGAGVFVVLRPRGGSPAAAAVAAPSAPSAVVAVASASATVPAAPSSAPVPAAAPSTSASPAPVESTSAAPAAALVAPKSNKGGRHVAAPPPPPPPQAPAVPKPAVPAAQPAPFSTIGF